MFKVVPDQLRISEGWVRCGHCSEVFDASANLQASVEHAQPAVADTAPWQSPGQEQQIAAGEPVFESAIFPTSEIADAHREPYLPSAPQWQPLSSQEPAQAAWQPPVDAHTEQSPVSAMHAEPAPSAIESPGPESEPTPQPQPEPAKVQTSSPRPSAPIEPEPQLDDLSFVRQAQRKAFWQSQIVRAGLLVTLFGLSLLLALQVVLHDRDWLASSDPALRPLLVRMCDTLNCSVSAARQIDSIVIDSSAFNRLRGDAYRLSVSLKNQSNVELAMPALELTLTDGQDQAVLRRVLLPDDLPTQPSVIAPSSEWSGSMTITVATGGNLPRIAGYRLLAFYP